MEQFAERAGESIGVQGTRGGEFGGGFQNTRHDHGQDQIELATGVFIDEPVELQFAQGAQDGGNVAVRAGADDIERLRKRDTDGSRALQDGAEGIDLSRGPMGNIGEGAVVSAGSVVLKDVPPNCLVRGNPATVVYEIFRARECAESSVAVLRSVTSHCHRLPDGAAVIDG